VFTGPGDTVTTRTPCGAYSVATAFDMSTNAALKAPYDVRSDPGLRALMEEMLMIAPPLATR
jgi:hypothetical protein